MKRHLFAAVLPFAVAALCALATTARAASIGADFGAVGTTVVPTGCQLASDAIMPPRRSSAATMGHLDARWRFALTRFAGKRKPATRQ